MVTALKTSHPWYILGSVILLAIALDFPVCQGQLEFNVLDAVKLRPSTVDKFKDVKLTGGKDEGSPAYHLGPETSTLSDQTQYTKFKNVFDRSNDITFVFTFKLDQAITQQAAAFALLATSLGRQYLSFVIRITNSTKVGIEGESGKETLKMSIDFNYRYAAAPLLRVIEIDGGVKLNEWQNLMIRIINHKTIKTYLGCGNEPQTAELSPEIPALPKTGQIRAAQSGRRSVFGGQEEIFDRVVGVVQRLEFLFSSESFELLNPCIPREKTLRPEGLKSTPNEAVYLAKFLVLTSLNLPKNCQFEGKTYRNGVSWRKNKCTPCKCNNGLVEGCDINKPEFCLASACKDGTVTPPGECCPICQETYCARTGHVYAKCGCTEKCGVAVPATSCSTRCISGCHCPIGQFEDIDGKCVKQQVCHCKSKDGKITYRPNEISSNNPCLFLVCSLGTLRSLRVCFA